MQLVCHACMDYTVNYNFFAFLCVLVNNPFRKDNLKEKSLHINLVTVPPIHRMLYAICIML